MAELLCGVCRKNPKKYKCPTCALPYCSSTCFKSHKSAHADTSLPPPAPTEPSIPQPPPPAPKPSYLKKKHDFSVLATNAKFQDLLKTCPSLLLSLQRVYAKTIEPDPETQARRQRLEKQAFRGRGSRGRGGRQWYPRHEGTRKWTQKKGDSDAMYLLKSIRSGKTEEREKEGMAEFVELVEEIFGDTENKAGELG